MFRATSIFVLILLALGLSTLNLPTANQPGDWGAAPRAVQDAGTAAAALAGAAIPVSDLYQLAAQLRLKTDAPIPHLLARPPRVRHEGEVDQFNLARFKENDYTTLSATLRLVTDHAYWYVQNGYDVDAANLRTSATNFESRIYPTNHRYFGSEWSPGVDGDPHITVLTAKIPGVGGYFSSSDEYVRQINQFSNEQEIIYIATKPEGLTGAANFYEGVLAHEFQHMIHWNMQRNRDIWVDEGCSETAMALNGYDLGGSDTAFRNRPDVQLTSWSSAPDPTHYGAAYLFVRYAMAHYGDAGFLKALLASPGAGAEAVTGALKRQGFGVTFDDVFRDWVVANYVSDPAVADGRYAYTALAARVATDKRVIRYPATVTGDVHQYAADYVSLERGSGDTVVNFQGVATSPLAATVPHSGRRFWYSNRRDAGNMTLTRIFDLTGVRGATLDFWQWYNIESEFDYGYVEASTDGGKTWATLPGPGTTERNPNGANYGHGYTGTSGHDPKTGGPPVWTHARVDLSAYAGRSVLVRFQYVTDEGYNAPGWALDDISVPELGYYSDAETDDGGWQAAGWVRVANVVPQNWFVAAIEYGAGPHDVKVESLTIDAQGRGSLTIPGLGTTVRQTVLVVAGMAPTTTETAAYRIQVARTR